MQLAPNCLLCVWKPASSMTVWYVVFSVCSVLLHVVKYNNKFGIGCEREKFCKIAECKGLGGRMRTTLVEILRLPVYYDSITGARYKIIEAYEENSGAH